MSIRIGDKVFVIDESLEGKVISIFKEKIVIVCDEGFEYEYLESQLFKINDDHSIEHSTKNLNLRVDETEKKQKNTQNKITFKGDKAVFDLHIEEITSSNHFVNAHEKLIFQLSYVRQILSEAKRKRVRRLVLVHGIGKGRLREELRKMLDESYPQVEYFDGDYRSFGQGATEIIIRQF